MSGAATRRYLVSGRVQGVGFRYFVVECARDLGIEGFARNLPDGRVEVVAHAEPAALERLEGRLRRGPSAARVEALDVRAAEPGTWSGFGIRT